MSVRAKPARDANGRFMPKRDSAHAPGPKRASASAPGMDVARRAASTTDQVLAAWRPGLTAPNHDTQWERDEYVGRTRDLVNNSSWAAGAVDRVVANVVGFALRFSSRHGVMAKLLGIPVETASILSTQVERALQTWGNDPLGRCDWHGRMTAGEMIALAYRHRYVEGRGLGVLRFDETPRPGWKWRTSLQLVDPDRLSQPLGVPERPELSRGVETDGREIVAYHFREAHPADRTAYGKQLRWERVPARHDYGRPIVLDLRATHRAGELHGVSPFVAVLRRFKALDRYTEAEIQAAAVNALFAAVFKTTRSSGDAADALNVKALDEHAGARAAFYGSDARLSDGSKIAQLYPEDELQMLTTPRHVASYQGFASTTLQAIAAGLPGCSYETLSMDFSKTNYSSFRGAQNEAWKAILNERALVVQQFAVPMALAVIEEAIDNGDIDVPPDCPELYECPAGWLAGRWIGPGRGYVDAVKEVTASAMKIAGGLSTLEDETLENTGGDYEANVEQLAYEKELFAKSGLAPAGIAEMTAAADAANAVEPRPEEPAPENSPQGGQ
jgi:lambda family phage portal protein